LKKRNNPGKFDLAASSQEIWRTYEDASKQLLKDIKTQLLFDEVAEGNDGIKESWRAGLEMNVIALRVGVEGLIKAECNRWKYPAALGGNLAKFYYTIKYSNESDDIIITPVDLHSGANMTAKAEKITEIKIDLSSSNENFIAGMVSHVFAKVKNRVAVRNNLRIVHTANGVK
jgi:hypothetical protein